MRLHRWEHGQEFVIQESGMSKFTSPPQQWVVQVQGDHIRFYGDGELIFDVVDNTYRSGYFGFWANGNGTKIEVSDIRISNKFRALTKK